MNNLINAAIAAIATVIGFAAIAPAPASAICNDPDACAPAPVVAAQDDSASGRGSGRIDPKLGYRGSGRLDPGQSETESRQP